MTNRHRRFRRNPDASGERGMTIFGIMLPPLATLAGVATGIIVPPIVASYAASMVPASMKNADGTLPTWLNWTIKAASVLVPSLVVRRFVNRKFGNAMLVGGLGYILVEIIRPYLPSGLGYQPLLGAYFTRPTRGGQVLAYPRQTASLGPGSQGTPSRLDPALRY